MRPSIQVFKCPTYFFCKKGKIIDRKHWSGKKTEPCRTFSSEPFSNENELFTFNTSKFKDMALAFHRKGLILLVQIPHPSLAVQKGGGFAKNRVVYHFTREAGWMAVEVNEVHEDPSWCFGISQKFSKIPLSPTNSCDTKWQDALALLSEFFKFARQ